MGETETLTVAPFAEERHAEDVAERLGSRVVRVNGQPAVVVTEDQGSFMQTWTVLRSAVEGVSP